MSLENLIKTLENQLKMIQAKKELAIQKGAIELLFSFDSQYIETLFTLETLKLAIKNEEKGREAPPRKVQEIKERARELFDVVNREWLRRGKGEKNINDFEYGIIQGELKSLEWILGNSEILEIPKSS
jgi:hypothetical protein